MEATSSYKPIGGVESVALYPTDAVEWALFSANGCEVELSGSPIEVELLDSFALDMNSGQPDNICITVSTAILLPSS